MFRSSYDSNTTTVRVPLDTGHGDSILLGFADSIRRRLLLLTGAVLLAAVTLTLFEPAAYWADDPELFRLLRGMGVLKALMAVSALAAVWWRLGRTITARLNTSYIVGVWAMALATALIWELTGVLAASALFHLATFVVLITAWRDVAPRVAQSN